MTPTPTVTPTRTPTPTWTPTNTPTVTPQPISTLVPASAGGSLRSNDQHQSTLIEVGPGAFITDSLLTYSYRAESGAGRLIGVRHGFELSATDLAGAPVGLSDTITVTISYTDSDLGPAIESSLRLYRLEGSSWVTQGVTSTLDVGRNLLVSLIDRLGRFAALAETNRVYMPVAFKSLAGGW